jgi:hypothetical protein
MVRDLCFKGIVWWHVDGIVVLVVLYCFSRRFCFGAGDHLNMNMLLIYC